MSRVILTPSEFKDCPNGTFGKNCMEKCGLKYYGWRCQFECNCLSNETCNKATGCEEIINVDGTQPDFFQSRHKTSDIDIEDDDPYSEIRESLMVRPMTVYGRKLSIRSSKIDPDDQYHRIELATSLRRPNLDKPTIEYTDYTEPIDEPLLQPKTNIYEQLIIDESTETQRNSDNAIYAEVVENQNNACSPQKHLNTTERSDKCNLVTEVDYTDDKGDNCTERETTVYSMQMPLNTSEISNKTDVVIEIQDNTTYAKVVQNSNNECSSKIHLNTTGIPDKSNFVTGTNNNEEISENSTKSKVHTADSNGEMTTESESERQISSLQCEEDNSNKNIVLNKIMSDYEDTPVMISVSVGKQTIFIDLKDRNVLNSLSNDGILENAITSVQMTTNVNKK
ncbi:unnamed protein product [Mytilus coruscus]|uniref:MEGF10_11 n=1 Tax=Mytilus coruscus TaxID=42192 RepID=A0A6J8DME0_MYTCO|nr:unnamed protein product [Mytilus coruscus]